MAKLQQPNNLGNVKELKDIIKFSAIFISDVYDAFLKGISFQDNLDVEIVTVNFESANTTVPVMHGLKRIPTGYITVYSTVAAVVYAGTGNWTLDTVFLKSSAIGEIKIILF